MDRDDMQRWRKQQPFQPFRIFVRDGRIYNVIHPRMMLLSTTFMIVGIPAPDLRPPMCDRTEYVRLEDVERIDPLPPAANLWRW